MRILFLSPWLPLPQDNGSKIRIYNLLRGLASRHDVSLLAFSRATDQHDHLPALRELCSQVELVPWKAFEPDSLCARLGLISPKPRSLVDTHSPRMQQLIMDELRNAPYDAIVASELTMGTYAGSFAGIPALLEDLELGGYAGLPREGSRRAVVRHKLTWLKTRSYVARLLKHFRTVTVVSPQEYSIVSPLLQPSQHVAMVPNCLDCAAYEPIQAHPLPNSLIFSGALTYAANYDGLSYFLEEIYPLVKAAVPAATLRVTGRCEGVPLPTAFDDESIHFDGYIDDIKTAVARSWVSIVPIRKGSGTRLKILEALALGTAVVSTSKGAEGLELEHGVHLLLADTPQDFAEATIQLLKNAELRFRLGRNGQQRIAEKYDWSRVLPQFVGLVEALPGL
ncbi:MAG: glycosyltransferase family 4 protein [Anaerolineae bacterium]